METDTSATSRALHTYELLESILLRSTSFDVLIATSVCKYWREVIESYKALRQYMRTLNFGLPFPRSLGTTGDSKGEWWPCHTYNSKNQVYHQHGPDCRWHFRLKVSHGTLWVLRLPRANLEVFLLVPNKKKAYLRVLDGERYDCLPTAEAKKAYICEEYDWAEDEVRAPQSSRKFMLQADNAAQCRMRQSGRSCRRSGRLSGGPRAPARLPVERSATGVVSMGQISGRVTSIITSSLEGHATLPSRRSCPSL